MGYYTGLRFKGIVNPSFKDMIKGINNGENWTNWSSKHEIIEEFSKRSRADFIPNGISGSFSDFWEEGEFPNQEAGEGFGEGFNYDTGYWAFQCSLKNHEGDLTFFLEKVLPLIAESSEHIEVFYEEWSESNLYEISGSGINKLNKGIYYQY